MEKEDRKRRYDGKEGKLMKAKKRARKLAKEEENKLASYRAKVKMLERPAADPAKSRSYVENMDRLNISSSSSNSPLSISDSEDAMEDEITKPESSKECGPEKLFKEENVKSLSVPVIVSATKNEKSAGTVIVKTTSASPVLSPEALDPGKHRILSQFRTDFIFVLVRSRNCGWSWQPPL